MKNNTKMRIAKKYAHAIEEIHKDMDGVWAYTVPGWKFGSTDCHTAMEYTQKDLRKEISTVTECDCKECQSLIERDDSEADVCSTPEVDPTSDDQAEDFENDVEKESFEPELQEENHVYEYDYTVDEFNTAKKYKTSDFIESSYKHLDDTSHNELIYQGKTNHHNVRLVNGTLTFYDDVYERDFELKPMSDRVALFTEKYTDEDGINKKAESMILNYRVFIYVNDIMNQKYSSRI